MQTEYRIWEDTIRKCLIEKRRVALPRYNQALAKVIWFHKKSSSLKERYGPSYKEITLWKLMHQIWLKLGKWSWISRLLGCQYNVSMICYYLPLEKSMALYLKKGMFIHQCPMPGLVEIWTRGSEEVMISRKVYRCIDNGCQVNSNTYMNL